MNVLLPAYSELQRSRVFHQTAVALLVLVLYKEMNPLRKTAELGFEFHSKFLFDFYRAFTPEEVLGGTMLAYVEHLVLARSAAGIQRFAQLLHGLSPWSTAAPASLHIRDLLETQNIGQLDASTLSRAFEGLFGELGKRQGHVLYEQLAGIVGFNCSVLQRREPQNWKRFLHPNAEVTLCIVETDTEFMILYSSLCTNCQLGSPASGLRCSCKLCEVCSRTHNCQAIPATEPDYHPKVKTLLELKAQAIARVEEIFQAETDRLQNFIAQRPDVEVRAKLDLNVLERLVHQVFPLDNPLACVECHQNASDYTLDCGCCICRSCSRQLIQGGVDSCPNCRDAISIAELQRKLAEEQAAFLSQAGPGICIACGIQADPELIFTTTCGCPLCFSCICYMPTHCPFCAGKLNQGAIKCFVNSLAIDEACSFCERRKLLVCLCSCGDCATQLLQPEKNMCGRCRVPYSRKFYKDSLKTFPKCTHCSKRQRHENVQRKSCGCLICGQCQRGTGCPTCAPALRRRASLSPSSSSRMAFKPST